jgi:hypothetical protein
MTNDVRRNFYRQVWHVLSNDETMQIMTYIEVCMILMAVADAGRKFRGGQKDHMRDMIF